MRVSLLTTIGRPIDPSYPTNRAIVGASLLVGLGALLFRRLSGVIWTGSVLWGAQAALSVFLAWSLCRELDPDHDLAAFVSSTLALGGLFLWGLPRLSVLLWLILSMRTVNRTMGLPAGILDSVGVLGLGLWLSFQGEWGWGVITVLAFFLDTRLPNPLSRQLIFAGIGILCTATAAILEGGPLLDPIPSVRAVLLALGISGFFLPIVLESRTLASVGDQTGRSLQTARVRSAQAIALVVGVVSAFLNGFSAFPSLMSLWAGLLGASLFWFYRLLRARGAAQ